MNKIDKLVSLCKAGVYVTINQHRDYYETVEKYFEEDYRGNDKPDPEIFALMVQHDRVVEVQFYPHTPIGSYTLYGFTLDTLLDEAIEIATKETLPN